MWKLNLESLKKNEAMDFIINIKVSNYLTTNYYEQHKI